MSRTDRIYAIDDFIKRFGKVTKSRLVDYLEVSRETIKKDIAYMRDMLQAPIKYDPVVGGYIYTEPFEYLSFASEETILFYVFVEALADEMHRSGINTIPVVPKDLLKTLSRNIRDEYFLLLSQIEYHSSAIEQTDTAVLLRIVRAMRCKNKISIHYVNANGEKSERELEPYKLINYLGNWYLVAYCHIRESLATFLVARIQQVTILDAEFDSRTDVKDVEAFISGSAGMYKSEHPKRATVRFYEPALHKVKRQIWHKDQQIDYGEVDGKKYVEFTVPVGWSYEEILGKVLAYAPDSEVIAPLEFRAQWKHVIAELYERYCSS